MNLICNCFSENTVLSRCCIVPFIKTNREKKCKKLIFLDDRRNVHNLGLTALFLHKNATIKSISVKPK